MKSFLKLTLLFSSGLSLIAGFSSPATAKSPSDSGKGTIVVKLDSNSRASARKLTFGFTGDSLNFYRYEGDESEALLGTAKGKGSRKTMPLIKTEDGYLSLNVKPGRYFLASVGHKSHWGGCLNKETMLFDVKPNTATHIGTMNVSGTLSGIKSRVRISGDQKVEATYTIEHYYTDINSSPEITPPNSVDLQNAAGALKNKNPDFDGAVVSGNTRAFSFKKRVRKKGIINVGESISVSKCGK